MPPTRLSFLGQVGYSWGDGKTPTQNVSETNPGVGTGASYQLNGIGSGPSFDLGNTNNTTPTPGGVPVAFGWIFGDQDIDVKDTEEWAKIDSDFKIDDGSWTDLKFGVRYEKHDRTSAGVIGQGPTCGRTEHCELSDRPSRTIRRTSIPSAPTFRPTSGLWTPAQLAAYDSPDQRQPQSGDALGLELHVRGV